MKLMYKIPKALNSKGAGHLFLAPLIAITLVGISGAYILSRSNAATVQRTSTVFVSTDTGCGLAGRRWVSSSNSCSTKCISSTAQPLTIKGTDGTSRGYCSGAVAISYLNGNIPSECNKLGRRFVHQEGCSRRADQKTLLGADQCIYSSNTYYAAGAEDYCGINCNGTIIKNIGSCPGTPTPPVVTVPSPPPSSSSDIDTSNKDAVNTAYKNLWLSGTKFQVSWNGSVNGCNAGNTNQATIDGELNAVNFARRMAGLSPATAAGISSTAQLNAQQTALIMSANQSLSHNPPSTWKCYTSAGGKNAASSDLLFSYSPLTPTSIISLYFDEPGTSNNAVGHRRWLLYPGTSMFSFGTTSSSSAIQVIGLASTNKQNPAWVQWPSDGYFPDTLDKYGKWSISAGNANMSFASATVRVTHNGVNVPVTKYPVESYGRPGLVWQMPSPYDKTGTYNVSITGVTLSGSASKYSTSYSVNFFTPY